MSAATEQRDLRTHHRTASVNGRKVFYREAGDPAFPTIVLLHGFPSSSSMFRCLIPALSDRFHLIAPDYIGFGHSEAPSRDAFQYNFDTLTAHVRGLLDHLQVTSYVLYVHDIGGPIGFRLFAETPDQVEGLIIQNANMRGVRSAHCGGTAMQRLRSRRSSSWLLPTFSICGRLVRATRTM